MSGWKVGGSTPVNGPTSKGFHLHQVDGFFFVWVGGADEFFLSN